MLISNLKIAKHPWLLIVLFWLCSILIALAGFGKILNFIFPFGAFLVATVLYQRQPVLYTGFVLWLWFLTPLARRIADFYSVYNEPSPMLLAPYFACLVSVLSIFRNPRCLRRAGLGFILVGTGILYGLIIGTLNYSLLNVAIAGLGWLVPVVFCFHIYTAWPEYPIYKAHFVQVFKWGVLVMGIYALIQFTTYPPWDSAWQINAEFNSVGPPQPFSIRVWSTMNSVGPFANTVGSGLLLILNGVGVVNSFALFFGSLSFILTLGRAAWAAWVIALVVIYFSLNPKSQIRILIFVAVIGLLVVQTIGYFPSSRVFERFDTFSNLGSDNSAEARKLLYESRLDDAFTSWLGQGIGGNEYDSGFITLMLSLGWFGALFYLSGLILLLCNLVYGYQPVKDYFLLASRAIVFTTILKFTFGNLFSDINGIFFWFFIGVSLSGHKYWKNIFPEVS